MALTDKDMALDLINVLEDSFSRCMAYELFLAELNSERWNQRYKELKNEQVGKAKKLFSPMRELILEAPDWREGVHEMLEGLEGPDPGD
jgi:hypothetical protein